MNSHWCLFFFSKILVELENGVNKIFTFINHIEIELSNTQDKDGKTSFTCQLTWKTKVMEIFLWVALELFFSVSFLPNQYNSKYKQHLYMFWTAKYLCLHSENRKMATLRYTFLSNTRPILFIQLQYKNISRKSMNTVYQRIQVY